MNSKGEEANRSVLSQHQMGTAPNRPIDGLCATLSKVARTLACGSGRAAPGNRRRILLLPCYGNILCFRSEAVERMGGRKPTFLLPDGVHGVPA